MTITTPATGQMHRSARQRLLEAADELFYAEGVQTVGIDRIIERAGVAKASLYNTFGSKEELVEAYLSSRHSRVVARLTAAVEQHTDPVARLFAFFDAQAEILAQPDFRGCAFMSASAEAPPGGLIERASDAYRSDIRGLLTRLAEEAGVPEPATLGRQLHLIYDGSNSIAQLDRDPSIAVAARAAVGALLDAAQIGTKRPCSESVDC
jgi:AcrR family transcriptional regulator